jgi:hypothetical protein
MSRGNKDVVDASLAWPVATVVKGLETIGVVMAKAPDRFSARRRDIRGAYGQPQPLVIDLLVMPGKLCEKRGIKAPDIAVRSKAMLDFLRIGALFDDYDIVYADWSYKNAFWEQGFGSIFVIDMDTCGIGTRRWIESPEWDDPLFPESVKPPLNSLSDRYKLAVLAVRCLTGERRDPIRAHQRLVQLVGTNDFTDALHQALTAKTPEARPNPYHLLAASKRWIDQLTRTASRDEQARPKATTAGAGPRSPKTDVTGPVDPAALSPGNVTGHFDLRSRKAGQPPKAPPSTRGPTDGMRTSMPRF